MIGEVLTNAVVPLQRQLEAVRLVDTRVGAGGCTAIGGRIGDVDEHAVVLTPEVVERTREALAKESEVGTDVRGVHTLPGTRVVGDARDPRGGIEGAAVNGCTRGDGCIGLVVADGRHVTRLSPGCAELQVREPVDVLHERLL